MSKSNIEILLGEWGAWKRQDNRSTLGYPDKSAFMIMRVDGQRRADPHALLVGDELRKLDSCIENLYLEAKTVIVAHYVWIGTAVEKIRRLKITKTAYYSILDAAHKQLEHWMGAGYCDELIKRKEA